MEEPRPRGTTLVIIVSPRPGKYEDSMATFGRFTFQVRREMFRCRGPWAVWLTRKGFSREQGMRFPVSEQPNAPDNVP